jgi:Leucine rich repeat/Secretion system C-terminal sorting domain
MRTLLLIVWIFSCVFTLCNASLFAQNYSEKSIDNQFSKSSAQDSMALVSFYYQMKGHTWKHPWDLRQPMISWFGLSFLDGKLVEMDLSDNQLTIGFPNKLDSLQVFSNLEVLNLSENQFLDSKLPPAIGRLKKLKILELDKNNLTEIPKEIGQLENLQKLSLSKNKLKKLPAEIAQLKKLKELYLQDNLLEQIPKEIGKLTETELLNLSHNQLKELPMALKNLQKLKFMNVSGNYLRQLPDEIAALPNLQKLYLEANELEHLPPTLARNKNLNELKIAYNRLTFADLEAFADKSFRTFDYSPQDRIGLELDTNVLVMRSFVYSLPADAPDNQYQWQKNNTPTTELNSISLAFPKVRPDDASIYNCVVTNKRFPLLSLHSRSVSIRTQCGDPIKVRIQSKDPMLYCKGDSILTQLEAVSENENVNFQWYKDNEPIFQVNDRKITVRNTGTYKVQLSDAGHCGSFSADVTIGFYPLPQVEIEAEGSKLKIRSAYSPLLSYQWYLDGQAIKGATDSVITAQKQGRYVLKIKTETACTQSSNLVFMDETNLENVLWAKGVRVYPNPAREYLDIDIPSDLHKKLDIRLFTIEGKWVEQAKAANIDFGRYVINLQGISNGIYVLRIRTAEGELSKKILKE